eukprot:TRINITY_DN6181_c0_g1_i1.p1 TRINITY_DN6181_c0_g1~~TRINITY_DN6181_c0_g1_i1.p1  ORF type:complete len:613 (-),score=232.06 TRINITY_DN6181_c0_g1_i1:59-1897(-)
MTQHLWRRVSAAAALLVGVSEAFRLANDDADVAAGFSAGLALEDAAVHRLSTVSVAADPDEGKGKEENSDAKSKESDLIAKDEGKGKDGKDGKEGKDGKGDDGGGDELQSEAQDTEQANAKTQKAWQDMLEYLKRSGGNISESIVTRMMEHGGSFARGIVAKSDMKNDEVLFAIPKSMWIHIDNFPEMKASSLSCGWVSTRIVTALAMEIQKGTSSTWWPYIENLPTREDFKRFYPRWAKEELLEEFDGTTFVADIRTKRSDEQTLRECWENWRSEHAKKGDKPDLGNLSWKEMELAYAWWRSRNYGFDDQNALIPVSDFMNTAPKSDFNARWKAKSSQGENGTKDYFEVFATADVAAGTEYYESYCRECSNWKFLETWGIYMEDNPIRTDKEGVDVCARIMPKALEALENPSKKSENMTAPRCKKETIEKAQGALRCNMARLAFEACDGVLEEAEGKGKTGKVPAKETVPEDAKDGKDGKSGKAKDGKDGKGVLSDDGTNFARKATEHKEAEEPSKEGKAASKTADGTLKVASKDAAKEGKEPAKDGKDAKEDAKSSRLIADEDEDVDDAKKVKDTKAEANDAKGSKADAKAEAKTESKSKKSSAEDDDRS